MKKVYSRDLFLSKNVLLPVNCYYSFAPAFANIYNYQILTSLRESLRDYYNI